MEIRERIEQQKQRELKLKEENQKRREKRAEERRKARESREVKEEKSSREVMERLIRERDEEVVWEQLRTEQANRLRLLREADSATRAEMGQEAASLADLEAWCALHLGHMSAWVDRRVAAGDAAPGGTADEAKQSEEKRGDDEAKKSDDEEKQGDAVECVAEKDFDAAEDGEMSLRVGERFIVEKSELENPDGWCFATRYDQTGDGYVPAAYLRLSQPGSGRPKWMPTAV